MTGKGRRMVPFAAALLAVVMVGWALTLRAARPGAEGIPTDWTSRHVIFSPPSTLEQASRIAQDPRYRYEWYRQNVVRKVDLDPDSIAGSPLSSLLGLQSTTRTHADWSEDMGTGASSGAGNFPAKYSFSVSVAACGGTASPDYVVFGTGLSAAGTAKIVAFDNLYVGCTAPVPAVYWAYDTGGQVLTSPVISGDGTQIAFVQTTAGAASLVVLKWAPGGTIASPTPLASTPSASFRSCSAPCMTAVPLKTGSGNDNDTTSSPFPDYTHDVIWVGGASGWLHKVTGVFRGAPAEVSTGGYPIQVNASGKALSSPVFDIASGNVFVGDAGGFLYRISVTPSLLVTASAQIDKGIGLLAGPIVDSTAGFLYAFASNDGTTACAGGAACAAVYSFSNTFASGNAGTSKAQVGTSSATPKQLYEAAFDHAYWSSGSGTGSVYVCGATGVAPLAYRVPVAAGVFGTAVSLGNMATAATACSPVTDIYNPNVSPGPEERIYFSMQNHGRPAGCVGIGCAVSYISLPWQATTVYKPGQEILIYRAASNALYTNVVLTGGTSGAAAPAWPVPAGTITVDGTVHWMNQGLTQLTPPNAWAANHPYVLHNRIVDPSGNVQVITTAGTSGGTIPSFNATLGLTTGDGGATWTNAGVQPVATFQSNGGTSGIILDNVVAPSPAAATSQIYFSTLANQACPTSGGTGGCAVQASQSTLK